MISNDKQYEPLMARETNTPRTVYVLRSKNRHISWLAQLVERQSAVREVEGSSPRPDQHSGS